MDDNTSHLQHLKGLVVSIHELNVSAEHEYTPIVEEILRSHNRDIKQIENTLDGLFDFCGYEPGLLLFKRLCRYYYDIDPAATVNYIHHYRDYWDAETETQSSLGKRP